MGISLSPGISDDDVLNYTQNVRKQFVDQLTEYGTKMPADKGEASLMLQALTDMDRVAISKKKLVIEQGQSEADRLASQIIARLAQNTKLDVFATVEGSYEEITPDLSQLPHIELVAGVTGIGVEDNNYDSFVDSLTEEEKIEAQKQR